MNFYKKIIFGILCGLCFACSEKNNEDPTPEEPTPGSELTYKKEGYVIGTVMGAGAGTYFAGYFDKTPSGNIDMTTQTSFGRFRIKRLVDGVMYGFDTNEANRGLGKYVIDKETNKVKELGKIDLGYSPYGVVILNETKGLISNSNSTDIVIFNPKTMTVEGKIDMSNADKRKNIEFDQNGYSSVLYNKKLNKIYAVNYVDSDKTPQYYDAKDIVVEVIDATSLKHEKTIKHPNAEYAIFRGDNHEVIDEIGNTYLVAQGQYGMDGKFGPKAPKGSRPQILKINTNSEFELDYAFNPIDALGFQNNYFQMFVTMIYGKDNKAYGIGTAKTDDIQILALLQKWAKQGKLSKEDYASLQKLVLYGESLKLLEIDLLSKTVKEVSGTPFTAGFSYPMLYNYDGKIYNQVAGTSQNGFYELDLSTNNNKKLFNITAGGFAYQFIDLKAEF